MNNLYTDVLNGGTTPDDPEARRRARLARPPSEDPLLDEMMSTNDRSPSAPKLPDSPLPAPRASLMNNGDMDVPQEDTNMSQLPDSPYVDPGAQGEGAGAAPTPPPAETPAPPASPTPPSNAPYTPPYVVEGLDMTKLANDTGVTPKYQFWRAIQQGVPYEQAVRMIGGTVIDGNRFRLADGLIIDTRRDEEGANAAQWLELGGGSGGAGGAGGAGGSGASAGGQGWYNDQLHQMLMHELQGLQGPIDPNDPNIQNRVTAFRNQQARGAQDARSALVEKARYAGTTDGFVDTAIQSGLEDAALNTAKYEGDITAQEYQARRDQLARLLSMALSSQDSAAARDLQAQISALDREQQNRQFYDTMGYNINRDQNNLDVILAQLLLRD